MDSSSRCVLNPPTDGKHPAEPARNTICKLDGTPQICKRTFFQRGNSLSRRKDAVTWFTDATTWSAGPENPLWGSVGRYLQSMAQGRQLYHEGVRYAGSVQMAHEDLCQMRKAGQVRNMLLHDWKISDVKLPALWKHILETPSVRQWHPKQLPQCQGGLSEQSSVKMPTDGPFHCSTPPSTNYL
jgi:hypothetical protein